MAHIPTEKPSEAAWTLTPDPTAVHLAAQMPEEYLQPGVLTLALMTDPGLPEHRQAAMLGKHGCASSPGPVTGPYSVSTGPGGPAQNPRAPHPLRKGWGRFSRVCLSTGKKA